MNMSNVIKVCWRIILILSVLPGENQARQRNANNFDRRMFSIGSEVYGRILGLPKPGPKMWRLREPITYANIIRISPPAKTTTTFDALKVLQTMMKGIDAPATTTSPHESCLNHGMMHQGRSGSNGNFTASNAAKSRFGTGTKFYFCGDKEIPTGSVLSILLSIITLIFRTA